jgi:hypothetical protein
MVFSVYEHILKKRTLCIMTVRGFYRRFLRLLLRRVRGTLRVFLDDLRWVRSRLLTAIKRIKFPRAIWGRARMYSPIVSSSLIISDALCARVINGILLTVYNANCRGSTIAARNEFGK